MRSGIKTNMEPQALTISKSDFQRLHLGCFVPRSVEAIPTTTLHMEDYRDAFDASKYDPVSIIHPIFLFFQPGNNVLPGQQTRWKQPRQAVSVPDGSGAACQHRQVALLRHRVTLQERRRLLRKLN